MEATLVINPGSSSRKYALYVDGQMVLEYGFESTDAGFEVCSQKKGVQQTCEAVSKESFESALEKVSSDVKKYLQTENANLLRIGVRIVAPGTVFQEHKLIDDIYLSHLRSKEVAAPLHVPAILREINQAKKYFPVLPIIGVSDSAFHHTMPTIAREYSIDRADAVAYDIHRFGYHGLSVESVVNRIHAVIGVDPKRLAVCHVGNGVSVTAVKEGKSVDTTMGFAPVSGLPMGSRAGDLDPSCLLEVMRLRNMNVADTSLYIHTNGGLSGLGGDGDIRRLLDRKARNDSAAATALEVFAYHIQKAIAAATVSMGGIDAIALTGTASVRSSELRDLLTRHITHLGLTIDTDKNDLLVGKEGVITAQQSAVKVVVMRTDEMGEMARIATQYQVPEASR